MITINALEPLQNIIDTFDSKLAEIELINEKDIENSKETLYCMIDSYVRDNIIKLKSYKFPKEVTEYLIEVLDENDLFNEVDVTEYIEECVDYYFNFIQTPRHLSNFNAILDIDYIEKRIDFLRKKPQPDQRTAEWFLFRGEHITASSAWKSFESQKTQNQLIYSKCAPINIAKKSSVNVNSACHHGHKYEPLSTLIYEFENDTVIEEFGCLEDDDTCYLAASPDGINVKKNNPLYGRLLEIKNPKSRIISGVPKVEYWVQMQFQMHVTKLHICDFLETTFTEYETEEDYLKDGTFSVSTDNKHKGVIICFNDGNGPIYKYSPLNISKTEFDIWYDNEMKENNNLSWIENAWWKVDVYSCVTVLYNKEWFDAAKPFFQKTWDTIAIEKEGGYEHRKATKRVSKPVTIISQHYDIIAKINALEKAEEKKNNKMSMNDNIGDMIQQVNNKLINDKQINNKQINDIIVNKNPTSKTTTDTVQIKNEANIIRIRTQSFDKT